MSGSASLALDGIRRRYPPIGVMATLENPSLGRRVAAAIPLAGVVNLSVFSLWYWWWDEPGMAKVQFALLLASALSVVLIAVLDLVRAGVAVLVWATLGCCIAGHVAMGGFAYSGGYLLWGIGTTVVCALWLSRATTALTVGIYIGSAVLLALLDSILREGREPPSSVVPVVAIVNLFLVTLVAVALVIVVLVQRIRAERDRNRELMLNILPETIADRLKAHPRMIADRFDACTILFADLVGFTAHSKGKDPEQIVGELNTIFTRFDALADEHGAEKIKTIGDGYMAATGLPDPDSRHVRQACDLALAMVQAMPALNAQLGTDFQVRVGVNTGSAVAGVVGTSKFSYDVWGDTVNLASRLESNGSPGVVAVSTSVARALDRQYAVESLGTRDLKGQGPTEVYRLIAHPSEPA